MKMKELMLVYAIGSIGYRFIEILWRGYTHWTMGIVGGICMICIYFSENYLKVSLPLRAVVSALCITCIEFVAGLVINIVFELSVWDYSGLPLNLLGQVSLPYCMLWLILCIPAHYLCKIVRHSIFSALPQKAALNKNF